LKERRCIVRRAVGSGLKGMPTCVIQSLKASLGAKMAETRPAL
jgi:hypothetical protein